jgi:hypothetical protein
MKFLNHVKEKKKEGKTPSEIRDMAFIDTKEHENRSITNNPL